MLDYQKIGLFLSKKRKLSKLTQKQLADKLNISFQAVSRWEKRFINSIGRFIKKSF